LRRGRRSPLAAFGNGFAAAGRLLLLHNAFNPHAASETPGTPVLLLKSSISIMFELIFEVMNGFWQLRDADTESAIALLPAKVVQLAKSLVNPGR
jgi:hypothetical protein